MTFLAPLFLFALAAVSIPIIIHLLNFRKPQRIAFSTLSFFQELQKSTIRRLKMKRWLLLALRVLAVIFLILALSRPFLNPSVNFLAGSGPVLYGIIIENGVGMNRIDADGPYIDQARDLANLVIDRARDQDRFVVFNTHGELTRSGVIDATQAKRVLAEIEARPKGNYLPSRLLSMEETMEAWSGDARIMYWFSSGTVATSEKLTDLDLQAQIPVHFVKVGNARLSNTVVSNFRTTRSVTGLGRPLNLEVEVSNLGDEPVSNHFVSLEVDDRLVGQYQADLSPGENRTFLFEVVPSQAGNLNGRVRLEGDAFTADNTHYFSIDVPENRNILLVTERNEPKRYLRSVLEAGQQVQSQIVLETLTIDQLGQFSNLDNYQSVVLDGIINIPDNTQELLQRFVQAGNGLVFYPHERGNLGSYNRFLSRFNAGEIAGLMGEYGSFNAVTRLNNIVEGHPVLETIFEKSESEAIRITLPSVYYYYRYRYGGAAPAFTLLRTALDDPLLIEHTYGNGRFLVSLMGTDPGWSAMPGNAFFAPVGYRTALYAASVESGGTSDHVLGQPFSKTVPLRGRIVDIRHGGETFRSEARTVGTAGLLVEHAGFEWMPGHYILSDEQTQTAIAVNLDVSESDFRSLSTLEIQNALANRVNLGELFDSGSVSYEAIQADIESAGFGAEVWNWFILLALFMLVAESAVSRWYKAETVT